MAMQRSMEIAINVFTDAETDTPCMYDTVLQIKVPSVHSVQLKDEKWSVSNDWKIIRLYADLFKIFVEFQILIQFGSCPFLVAS